MFVHPTCLIDARPVTLSELKRLGIQGMTVRDIMDEIDPVPFFDRWDDGQIEI